MWSKKQKIMKRLLWITLVSGFIFGLCSCGDSQQERQRLSKLEKQALELYLRGLSYQQIGEILHKSPKSIDNAIQRVKKKLEQYGSDR